MLIQNPMMDLVLTTEDLIAARASQVTLVRVSFYVVLFHFVDGIPFRPIVFCIPFSIQASFFVFVFKSSLNLVE